MPRLTATVGDVPNNRAGDVRYVQFLLTDWRLPRSLAALAIDGIVGPLTRGAITDFQRAETGIVDCRVDPAGPAIKRLEYLHIRRMADGIQSLLYLYGRSLVRPSAGPMDALPYIECYLDRLRLACG